MCRRILAPLGFSLLPSVMKSVMYEVTIHPSRKPFVLKVPTREDDCLGRREETGGMESTTKFQRSLPEQDKCHPGVGMALGKKVVRGTTPPIGGTSVFSQVPLESSEIFPKQLPVICNLFLHKNCTWAGEVG